MSAVVIRCPNCGTMQSALGECDACHHANVGYYCTNHDVGRFIDGPRCLACGATLGAASPPARPAPPHRTSPPVASTPVEWEPPPRAAPHDRPTERPPEWVVFEPRGVDVRDGPADPRHETIDPTVAAHAIARGAMGCVGRLVMMLIVLVMLALLLLGGFVSGVFGAEPGPGTFGASQRDEVRAAMHAGASAAAPIDDPAFVRGAACRACSPVPTSAARR